MSQKLWCDLKTDKEKALFLRLGRAVETGIIALVIAEEVAEVFYFRFMASNQLKRKKP